MQSGSQRGRVKRLPPAAQQLGKNDAHVAQTLHNLALLYRNSGQLDKAAAPYERSRGIWRAKEAWGLLAVSFKDSAVLCDLQVVKPPPRLGPRVGGPRLVPLRWRCVRGVGCGVFDSDAVRDAACPLSTRGAGRVWLSRLKHNHQARHTHHGVPYHLQPHL